MKNLFERELNWIINSPVFFSSQAELIARTEAASDFSVSLPGPVVIPNNFLEFTTAQSLQLLAKPDAYRRCRDELVEGLPALQTGRLGLVFERYLESIFTVEFGEENVLSRVPVREKNQHLAGWKTWGEFDFLIRNVEEKRIEHWESSIKFYLQVKDNPAWHNCWGPGLVDRLDLKGPKTFLQQLPLSSTSLGWESIPLAWRSWPLVKRVFAKGTIFYRWDPEREAFADRLKTLELPTGLNPEHQKSWWIMPESLAALRERYSRSKIAIVPRRFWMTGLIPFAGAESLENWNTFIANFALRAKLASEKKECLFVGIYDPTGKAQVQCFGFIATPHFFERFNQQ